MKRRLALALALVLVPSLPACEKLDDFDTKGDAAYCGAIVDAAFVRTSEGEGGFAHEARLELRIDTTKLTTFPGILTSDDEGCGAGLPTFVDAKIRVPNEIPHDPLSSMTFEDGQVQNIIGWVNASCRGSIFVIVSLLKTDRVDVRLIESGDLARSGLDVFSLFSLTRRENGCGF
jgi:hypothetical protein